MYTNYTTTITLQYNYTNYTTTIPIILIIILHIVNLAEPGPLAQLVQGLCAEKSDVRCPDGPGAAMSGAATSSAATQDGYYNSNTELLLIGIIINSGK